MATKNGGATKNPFGDFELVTEAVLSSASAHPSVNPVDTRRGRFRDGVEVQKQLFADPTFTLEKTVYVDEGGEQRVGQKVQKRPRSWVRKVGDTYFVTAKYGSRTLELQPGMSAAKLSKEQVVPFFDKLIELADSGYFDEAFAKAATRVARKAA